MTSILRICVPSILRVVIQHTEVLTVNIRSHSWYIRVTYISWSGSLSSQDWESMKLEVVRLIIQVTVVDWIINLTMVQFNMSGHESYILSIRMKLGPEFYLKTLQGYQSE